MPPNADELRYLIKKYWQEHQDPSKRSHAEDEAFLDRKVEATQKGLALIRDDLYAHDAENQVLTEVAFTE